MYGAPNSELRDFHRFVSDQLLFGRDDVSPEEAVDLWRVEHPLGNGDDETIAAVQEALRDMEDGDKGVSLEEFDRDFRQRHGMTRG